MELRKTPKLIFKELAILNKPNFIFCGNMLGNNFNKKMENYSGTILYGLIFAIVTLVLTGIYKELF